MRYYFGETIRVQNQTESFNFTYEYQQHSIPEELSEDFSAALGDYTLGYKKVYTHNGSVHAERSDFYPVEELSSDDSDLLLIFLSANNILYTSEVDDDWFAAHRFFKNVDENPSTGNRSMYASDEPASVLGCKIQQQICDLGRPSDHRCTRLGGNDDIFAENELGADITEMANWIVSSAGLIDSVLDSLRSSSLKAHDTLFEYRQVSLPNNQWQTEVDNFHSVVLASMQESVLRAATGPSDPGVLKYFWQRASSKQEQNFCKNQKILSTAYTNFSVFILAIILILGGIIIILGIALEDLVLWIEKRHNVTKHSRLEWMTNGALQTQRLAHEELGIGPWEGCAGLHDVPTLVDKGKILAILDTRDLSHPRLRIQDSELDEAKKPSENVGEGHENHEDSSSTERQKSSCISSQTCGESAHRENEEDASALEGAERPSSHTDAASAGEAQGYERSGIVENDATFRHTPNRSDSEANEHRESSDLDITERSPTERATTM